MNSELKRELSKKILSNLGISNNSISNNGITHEDYLYDKKIKLSYDNDIQNINVWYAEALGSESITCCLFSIINNSDDSFETVFVIGFKDIKTSKLDSSNIIGFKFDLLDQEDCGKIIFKINDKWIYSDLIHFLKLTLSFEIMVQDGVIWSASKEAPNILWKNLVELIEIEL